MGKDKFKKIPISEFISDKQLSKIRSIIEKSDDVETNYDRIEMLLDDDYKVKDLGTNRLVLLHKKSKYKNLIFKVAGDSHGIEANYREFYNGDLDKRLTFSYSISKDGTFVVQERVTRMTDKLMKKHKKDVREMLTKLSKKILLVDCKLENFKNFGIRDNGDVCLLDHGDTVPLPNYQSNDIVNINEESFVSLRCKKPEEMGAGKKHLKPCGGKLKYSKNFDYLICEECGGVSTVNDAYREFYGDKSIKVKGGAGLDLEDSFDPNEWKAHIQKYCIETMSRTDNNNLSNEGERTMKTKTIENRNCIQVKGFWLPEPKGEFADYAVMYTSVKMGETKPQKYLEKLGLDIDDYKVYPSEHTPSEKPKKKIKSERFIDEYGFDLLDARDKIIEKAISIGRFENKISYIECAQLVHDVDFSNMRNIKGLREEISSDSRTRGCIYNDEGFSIRLVEKYITNDDEDLVDNVPEMEEVNEIEEGIVINNYEEEFKEESEDNIDVIDSDNLAMEYAAKSNSVIVDDLVDEDSYDDSRSKLLFTHEELKDNAIDFNGVKCVVINKYAVPVDIIYRYSNEEGYYELPSSKMKALLKANGLQPKKYKITNAESMVDEEENVSPNTEPTSEEVASVYAPGKYNKDSETFMKELHELAEKYGEEYPESIDSYGLVFIPAADIIAACLLNHVDNGEVVDDLSSYCTIAYAEDDKLLITVDYKNIDSLYSMITAAGVDTDFACDYEDKTIGVLVKKYEPVRNDDYMYNNYMKSVSKFPSRIITRETPVSYLDASRYYNEDMSDPASEKHELFNAMTENLDEIFTSFYSLHNDNDLIASNDETEITEIERFKVNMFESYKFLKHEVFTNCGSLEDFYSYFRQNEAPFNILIFAALYMCDEFEDVMDEVMDAYEFVKDNSDEFMADIKRELLGETTNSDDDCGDSEPSDSYEESDSDNEEYYEDEFETENEEDESEVINSYTSDNNTNNNDEFIEESDESDEEEDEFMSQKVLDAIINLTNAVKTNNEIVSKQNDLMTIKLDAFEEKLNTMYESESKLANAVNDVVKSATQSNNISEEQSSDIQEEINNATDEIIIFSEDALNKKIIAVDINSTTVCFDIVALAKKAAEGTEDKYLSVSDITVDSLN